MDHLEQLSSVQDCSKILEIADFEPCFMHLFGIPIPENLKPEYEIPIPSIEERRKRINALDSIEKSIAYWEAEKIEQARIKELSLRTLPESLNRNTDFLKVSSKFTPFTKMTRQELRNSKNELQKLIKVRWLSNGIGEKHIMRALPAIEKIPNEVYQIGMQSSSTKDYFKYVATTEKRKVGIRFKVWFQYAKSTEERFEEIAQFFKEFDHFEEQIKSDIASMIFVFDELGKKKMTLKLNNSLVVEREKSSMHPILSFDFHKLYEEIRSKS